MADAIHRTALRFARSVDMTELPGDPSDWIRNPTFTPQARSAPPRYWKLDGTTVRLQTVSERAATDAALAAASRDAVADQLDEPEDVLRAMSLVLLDEINTLRAASVPPLAARTPAEFKTAVRAKLGS